MGRIRGFDNVQDIAWLSHALRPDVIHSCLTAVRSGAGLFAVVARVQGQQGSLLLIGFHPCAVADLLWVFLAGHFRICTIWIRPTKRGNWRIRSVCCRLRWNDFPHRQNCFLNFLCRLQVETTQVSLKEGGVQLRLTVVDTPGFGDAVDNSNWCVGNDSWENQSVMGQFYRTE